MKSSSLAAAIFLGVFGLPFIGMGLAFAFQSIVRGGPQAWIGAVFGVFFAFVGILLMAAAIAGFRIGKQEDAVRAANPDKPWLWRKDWAEGRANGNDPRANVTAWVFTAFWDFICVFVVYNVLPSVLEKRDPKALLLVILPLAGIVITAYTVRGTLRIWRYGRTSFWCDTVPFNLGGHVRGSIHVKLPTAIPHGIDLRLSCIRRIVSGSGKSQNVNEIVLWQDQRNIPAEGVMQGFVGAEIPVDFVLPADGYETNNENSRDRLYWQLHAEADVPGVDFSDKYELPVFRAAGVQATDRHSYGSALESSAQGYKATSEAESESPALAPTKTTVEYSDDGEGPRFYLPPMRNGKQGLGAVVFAALWTGVVYLLWTHPDAPWIFRIVFSLFEILVVYMLLNFLFGSALIRVFNGTLQVRNAILGIGRLHTVAFAEVASISLSSQGRPNASGELLYGIAIKTIGGRTINVAANSLTRVEARWILSTVAKAMGRKEDSHVEFQSFYGKPPERSSARSAE